MRHLALVLLMLSGQAAATSQALPDWATPGTETRSVREALDALHSASFPVDVMGDMAVVPAAYGPLAGMWMFTGGAAHAPPTRYYRFETPPGESFGTIVSIVCEDTPEACKEHAAALHRLSPPPPLPPPPPDAPFETGGVRGWTYGAGAMMPLRGVDTEISCIVCSPPPYPQGVVIGAPFAVVTLRVTVDSMGNVLDVLIQQSSRSRELDRAALVHARSWSFRPGMRGDVAVGGQVLVPVQFNAPSAPPAEPGN